MRVWVLLLLAAGCRTAAPPVSPFGAGTEEIVAKSRELNRAFTAGDAAVAQALMAPEYAFHWVAPKMHGRLMSTPNAPRGKWSEELFQRFRGGPLEWSTVDARVYGNLGVVVSHYRWIGSWDNQSFTYEGYLTDIWIRRSGRWQVLESHASLVPASF